MKKKKRTRRAFRSFSLPLPHPPPSLHGGTRRAVPSPSALGVSSHEPASGSETAPDASSRGANPPVDVDVFICSIDPATSRVCAAPGALRRRGERRTEPLVWLSWPCGVPRGMRGGAGSLRAGSVRREEEEDYFCCCPSASVVARRRRRRWFVQIGNFLLSAFQRQAQAAHFCSPTRRQESYQRDRALPGGRGRKKSPCFPRGRASSRRCPLLWTFFFSVSLRPHVFFRRHRRRRTPFSLRTLVPFAPRGYLLFRSGAIARREARSGAEGKSRRRECSAARGRVMSITPTAKRKSGAPPSPSALACFVS